MPFHPSYKNKQGKQVDLTVAVYTRPNLRDNEMFAYVGMPILKNIFDVCAVDSKTKTVNLYYPERWTNILEQRALLERIIVLYPNIEKVDITTHSVYIIQCTQACQVGICDDATKYPEKDYNDPTVRFCPTVKYNGSLMMVGGKIG